MTIVRFALKTILFLIYAAFAVALLYFPFYELLIYVGRETRLFGLSPIAPVDDALLPCFLLVLLYGVASSIFRKIAHPGVAGDDSRSPADE